MKRLTSVLGVSTLVLILSACGSSGDSGTPATSDGDATSAASTVAVTSAASAMGAGAGSGVGGAGAALSVVREILSQTVPINESFNQTVTCGSGSGSITGTAIGTATVSGQALSDLMMAVTIDGTMTNCAPENDPTTTFDESGIAISGTMNGTADVAISANQLSLSNMVTTASFTISGTGCPGGGTMEMSFGGSATAAIPRSQGQTPNFSGTMSGTVTGNACGATIDCTLSGSFGGSPTLSCGAPIEGL